MMKCLTYGSLVLILLFPSCRKSFRSSEVGCKPVLFGYKGLDATQTGTYQECTFGMMDRQTVSSSTMTTFLHTVHMSQGAYNTTDLCYYSFKYYDGVGYPILYKVNMEGVVSELKNRSSYSRYEGLLFNRFNNMLYAFKRPYGSIDIAISEISFNGSEYIVKDVVKGIGSASANSFISATVNDASGDFYYNLGTDSAWRVFGYHPGDMAAKLICSGTKARLLGLCFNRNDKMLYCITQDTAKASFVKLSTKGDPVTVSKLPFMPNPLFYSAVIDGCDNEYIISGKGTGTYNYFARLNMNGEIISKDTTATFFQGIAVVE